MSGEILDQASIQAVATSGHQLDNSSCDRDPSNGQVKEFDEVQQLDMTKRVKSHKKWNRRLKILFCCLGYKKNKVRFHPSERMWLGCCLSFITRSPSDACAHFRSIPVGFHHRRCKHLCRVLCRSRSSLLRYSSWICTPLEIPKRPTPVDSEESTVRR